MRRVWNILVSRNTSIVLLVAVSLLLIIGAVLPNPDLLPAATVEQLRTGSPVLFWLGQHFNSMQIGRSPVFGLVGLFLIVSTTACSIDRVMQRLRRGGRADDRPSGEGRQPVFASGYLPGAETRFLERLRKDRWRVVLRDVPGKRVIDASKGEWGHWGSIFFHAVLVTLIVGILMFEYAGFYGSLQMTEGEVKTLSTDAMRRIDKTPLFGMQYPELTFDFRSFSEEFHDDASPKDYTADFIIMDGATGRSFRQILKVNQPFVHSGLDFILVERGYAPAFTLYKHGRPVYDAAVALNLNEEYLDQFAIPGEDLAVTAQYFSDLVRNPDNSVFSRSRKPVNPHYGLDISRRGMRLFRGLVKEGDSVVFGDYRLLYRGSRHWVVLSVVKEPGIGFFFISGMVGILGVLARVLDPDTSVTIVLADGAQAGRIELYYSAKHFDGLLSEYAADLWQAGLPGGTEADHVGH